MKALIVLVVGLLAVGCGSDKEKAAPKSQAKVDVIPKVEAKGEVKELTIEEKVVGEYEYKFIDGVTYKEVLLDNGIREWYYNGNKKAGAKWSIVKGEIHVKTNSGDIDVWRINKDKNITRIAWIGKDGEREDMRKEEQFTYKRIK